MSVVALVVAAGKNRVIGRDGNLPWHLPEDMRYFKELTTGHPVVMGVNTWESIPENFRPLSGRTNIVVTHRWQQLQGRIMHSPSLRFVGSTDIALKVAEDADPDQVFVIGGESLYRQYLRRADEVYLTEVDCEISGDAFFPYLDPIEWKGVVVGTHLKDEKNEYGLRWMRYSRTGERSFVYMPNARTDDQRRIMEEIEKNRICPFCIEHLQNPVLSNRDHWVLTHNQWPYKNTQHHFLLISRRHAERLSDLSPEAGSELIQICAELERDYNILGGGLAIRFGDPTYNGGTVKHLHVHLLSAKIVEHAHSDYVPVRIRLA